jgi:PAS domain S-box-containing protein
MLASHDDLAIVLDNVADGVTVQDRSGRLVYANIAAARTLGFSTQRELLETPIGEILRRFEMFDEDGRPLSPEQLPGRRALQGQAEAAVTLRFRLLPDGEERWSSLRATPILDEAGAVSHAVNVWHDVTEPKRAELRQRFLAQAGELLASSLDVEATLANIAELAVPGQADWCAVHLVRDDGSISPLSVVHADPERTAWARRLQERYPPDPNAAHGVPSVIRTRRSELIPDVTDEMLVAVARDAEHLAIARRVGIRSAVIVPLVARGRALGAITLVAAESGRRYGRQDVELLEELARAAAMAIDNARHYNAERDARANAEEAHLRFRALFEGMPDAILVLDGDENITDANAGACELLGYDRAELIGMPVTDLIPAREGQHAGLEASTDLDEWRETTEVRRRDGTRVPVEAWFRKLALPAGIVTIGAMRDVSERYAADRAREEVLAAVSHDLKNPIGVIKAHVQLLQRMLDRGTMLDADHLRDRMAAIDAMGTRMALLLDDMTDVARSQRGETVEIVRAPTDLVALARACAAELAAASRDVDVDARAESIIGLWDARGVERVIHNLVQNAQKYSPEGGQVAVRISRVEELDGAWAELAVLDEGIGIPEGDRERIFDPYFRGSNVGGISGTGIGLAGARNIVEAQGGTIVIDAREPHGTVVTVRLPLDLPVESPAELTETLGDPPAAMPETPASPG